MPNSIAVDKLSEDATQCDLLDRDAECAAREARKSVVPIQHTRTLFIAAPSPPRPFLTRYIEQGLFTGQGIALFEQVGEGCAR